MTGVTRAGVKVAAGGGKEADTGASLAPPSCQTRAEEIPMELSQSDREKLIETYAKSYSSLTDEMATKLLNDYLALEQAHVALLRSYVPRFEKVLPPKKVGRLYQVENKLRALVNYELAREIPFVK